CGRYGWSPASAIGSSDRSRGPLTRHVSPTLNDEVALDPEDVDKSDLHLVAVLGARLGDSFGYHPIAVGDEPPDIVSARHQLPLVQKEVPQGVRALDPPVPGAVVDGVWREQSEHPLQVATVNKLVVAARRAVMGPLTFMGHGHSFIPRTTYSSPAYRPSSSSPAR